MTYSESKIFESSYEESEETHEEIAEIFLIIAIDYNNHIDFFKITTKFDISDLLISNYNNTHDIKLLLNYANIDNDTTEDLELSTIIERKDNDYDGVNEIFEFHKNEEYCFEDFVNVAKNHYNLDIYDYNDAIYIWKNDQWFYFNETTNDMLKKLIKNVDSTPKNW